MHKFTRKGKVIFIDLGEIAAATEPQEGEGGTQIWLKACDSVVLVDDDIKSVAALVDDYIFKKNMGDAIRRSA